MNGPQLRILLCFVLNFSHPQDGPVSPQVVLSGIQPPHPHPHTHPPLGQGGEEPGIEAFSMG